MPLPYKQLGRVRGVFSGMVFIYQLVNYFLSDLWAFLAVFWTFLAMLYASGHAILHKRHTHAAAGWVCVIWFVPVLGMVFYFLFGINRIERKARLLHGGRAELPRPEERFVVTPDMLRDLFPVRRRSLATLCQVTTAVTEFPLVEGNRIEPLVNGDEAFPAMLQAIDKAKESVSLCTYIYDNDPVGQRFRDALRRAMTRGVQVRVLADEIGAHYTYSLVPYDAWFASAFGTGLNALAGFERNHFDRLVHFLYGLLITPAAVELFGHYGRYPRIWAALFPLLFILSHSVVYELVEWGAALVFGGDLGQAYLGTQGDIWDAQKDMALAALGAAVTVTAYGFAGRLPAKSGGTFSSSLKPRHGGDPAGRSRPLDAGWRCARPEGRGPGGPGRLPFRRRRGRLEPRCRPRQCAKAGGSRRAHGRGPG